VRNRTLPLGLAIIAAGIVIVLGKLGVFQTLGAWLWPLLPLGAGLWMHFAVWGRRLPAVTLLPGAALAGLGLTFLLCVWFGWHWMSALWPLLPLSVAVGLYEFSLAERVEALRMVSLVAGGASLLAFAITLLFHLNGYVVALILIVVGVVVVARRPNLR
jgi:hypothetical protein